MGSPALAGFLTVLNLNCAC